MGETLTGPVVEACGKTVLSIASGSYQQAYNIMSDVQNKINLNDPQWYDDFLIVAMRAELFALDENRESLFAFCSSVIDILIKYTNLTIKHINEGHTLKEKNEAFCCLFNEVSRWLNDMTFPLSNFYLDGYNPNPRTKGCYADPYYVVLPSLLEKCKCNGSSYKIYSAFLQCYTYSKGKKAVISMYRDTELTMKLICDFYIDLTKEIYSYIINPNDRSNIRDIIEIYTGLKFQVINGLENLCFEDKDTLQMIEEVKKLDPQS